MQATTATRQERTASSNEPFGRAVSASVRYLELMGLEVLETDWVCPAGTADVIARDGDELVFCDVFVRTSLDRGMPEQRVTAEDRATFEKVAAWYLRDYESLNVPVRFDRIALLVCGDDRALVRHHRNAFGCGW